MWENATNLLCKLDLDLVCLRVYKLRGRYLKLLQYLYPLSCMSPDVTDILSRMQNIFLKPVQLVEEIVTCVSYFVVALLCVLFKLCEIHCFVVIYDKLYWSYLFGCGDYRKCNLIGWKLFSCPFPEGCPSCIFMVFCKQINVCATGTMSCLVFCWVL